MKLKKLNVLSSILLAVFLWIPITASAANYTYTGSSFSNAAGAYTTSMNLSGSFKVGTPIPPNTAMPADISALITEYSFNDGVQTLTNLNSVVVGAFVGTDANGNIGLWSFEFSSPVAAQVGNPASSIVTFNSAGLHRDLVQIGTCTAETGGTCTALTGTDDNAYIEIDSEFNAAPWGGQFAIPTLNEWGVVLFMLLAGASSMYFLRRRFSSQENMKKI